MEPSLRSLRAFALVLALVLAGCLGAGDDVEEDAGTPGAQDDQKAAERHLDVDVTAIGCPEGYDNQQEDSICLAYNGQIPGPTWVFQAGQRVEITLHNRVAETLTALGPDAQGARDLAEARYSLHRHGLSLDACSDGVAQPAGTSLCDSTVGPGESTTYTFDALFPGFWHYHDHAHTFTTPAQRGPILGGEGVERGLWGSFIVLPAGETTARVFDLHLTDVGPNGGLGLDGVARSGQRFDLDVVGLGFWHDLYQVRLEDPEGAAVGEVMVGPGVSRGITVHEARPGTYTWTAEGLATFDPDPNTPLPQRPGPFTGTITVAEGAQEEQGGPASAGRGASLDRVDTLPAPPAVSEHAEGTPASAAVADRVFVVPFNLAASAALVAGGGTMGLPLLEARVGEVLEFRVESADGLPHVFHLHGHPWVDPDTGDFIDAVPLVPGDKTSHTFTVVAGLEAGHAGDWLYHCHINHDSAMWGVLRVHP